MRPKWSAAGFARRVMMSGYRLVIVVEGRVIDPTFYDRAAEAAGLASRLVRPVDTIDFDPGSPPQGKSAVLGLFETMRRGGLLRQTTSRGTHDMLFVVDADCDLINQGKKRSPHILYTTLRDVELEVHIHGDQVRALSSALSLTREEAETLSANLGDYCAKLASLWRDWIKVGAVVDMLHIRSSIHSGTTSQINSPRYGPYSPVLHAQIEATLVAATDPVTFGDAKSTVETRVDQFFQSGAGYKVVKGKWLAPFIAHELKSATGGIALNWNGFETSYVRCMVETLDFSKPWARRYRRSMSALAAVT